MSVILRALLIALVVWSVFVAPREASGVLSEPVAEMDSSASGGQARRVGTGSESMSRFEAGAPAASGGTAPASSVSRHRALLAIRQVFRSRAPAAIRVAMCETGGTMNARAANWSDRHSDGSRGSFGLFQIGALHRDRGETVQHFAIRMFDPVANSRKAFRLSRGGTSWTPWACRP